MEFDNNGTYVRLHGLPSPQLHGASPSSLKCDIRGQHVSQYFHLSVSLNATTTRLPQSTTCENSTRSRGLLDHLHALLTRFSDIFSVPHSLPPVCEFDHKIPLQDNTSPVNVCHNKYPHFQKIEIERLVGEMLKEGIIRPSTSPFSSLVIIFKKKDEKWRFCVDYQALNAVTIRDRLSIPTVDELLNELVVAHVFSKKDLHFGYHQVWINPTDVEKMAFWTHEGHYEFLVMPFG